MRRLRLASWAEGATLLLLLLVAVPLKRLAGWPEAVSLMGPLHGAAFLLYSLMVFHQAVQGRLTGRETLMLFGAALVPLGFLLVGKVFARRWGDNR
jgi:integral membrane protein